MGLSFTFHTFHRPCFLPQRVHRIQSCEEDLLAALPTSANLGCSPWRIVVLLVLVSSRRNEFGKISSSQICPEFLMIFGVFLTLDGNSSVLKSARTCYKHQWSSVISECSARSGSVIIASYRVLFIVGKGQAMDGWWMVSALSREEEPLLQWTIPDQWELLLDSLDLFGPSSCRHYGVAENPELLWTPSNECLQQFVSSHTGTLCDEQRQNHHYTKLEFCAFYNFLWLSDLSLNHLHDGNEPIVGTSVKRGFFWRQTTHCLALGLSKDASSSPFDFRTHLSHQLFFQDKCWFDLDVVICLQAV